MTFPLNEILTNGDNYHYWGEFDFAIKTDPFANQAGRLPCERNYYVGGVTYVQEWSQHAL